MKTATCATCCIFTLPWLLTRRPYCPSRKTSWATRQGKYTSLAKHFMVDFDDSGAIGKRYRRQDEIGTPLCITIDFDTLEDETVTVRN